MVHDARAHLSERAPHALPDLRDNAAGFVPGDDGSIQRLADPDGVRASGRAIVFKIGTAHARGLDLEDHLARPRRRIRNVPDVDLLVAEEIDRLHRASPWVSAGI
jgi:hypothetical protein